MENNTIPHLPTDILWFNITWDPEYHGEFMEEFHIPSGGIITHGKLQMYKLDFRYMQSGPEMLRDGHVVCFKILFNKTENLLYPTNNVVYKIKWSNLNSVLYKNIKKTYSLEKKPDWLIEKTAKWPLDSNNDLLVFWEQFRSKNMKYIYLFINTKNKNSLEWGIVTQESFKE